MKLILHMPFLTGLGFPLTAAITTSSTAIYHVPPPLHHPSSLPTKPLASKHDQHGRRHGQDNPNGTPATSPCQQHATRRREKRLKARRTRQERHQGGRVQQAARTRYARCFLFLYFFSSLPLPLTTPQKRGLRSFSEV